MKNHYLKLLIKVANYACLGLFWQCFLVGLSIGADAEGQLARSIKEVSVEAHYVDSSLEEVFRDIESQTDFVFTYDKDDAFLRETYTNNAGKILVADLFRDLSARKNLIFQQVKHNISVRKFAFKKMPPVPVITAIGITGTVKSDEGELLPGVSVMVKGANYGTVTDADGVYAIEAEPDAVLLFSFIGYRTQEVPVNGRTGIDIVLEADVKQLNEVVVVGYGTQKKLNLTGAVSQVDAEDIGQRPAANITNALQGLLPGLNIAINSGDPAATPDINIRGFNSINGGGPLVLIDGIEGDITRVNPQDVANVTVLKDAASAAIYGARGAFGVILITTKRGKSGDMVVNYTNNFSWTKPTTRTDFISDPYTYGKIVDAAIFGYNGTNYTGYNDLDWQTIKMVADGEIDPFHEKQGNGTYKFFYKTNWYDYLFKEWQASTMHNLSISGGGDKLRAYLSGRFYDRETIQNIVDANMERYNLKATMTFQPTEWLELSNNVQFIHEKDEDFGGYRNGYGGVWSTTTWYGLYPFYPNMIDGMPTDVGIGGNGGQGGPAAMEYGNNWRRFNTEELTNTIRAKITPTKGLEFNFNYSNRFDNTGRTYRYNEFEYLTSSRLDLETTGINRLGEWRWKDKYRALNAFGSYTFDLKDKHNFKLLLGYNQEDFDRDRVAAQQSGLLVRDLANLATGTEMYGIDGSSLLWAVQGYFGRFNYNYKEKYLLEVNARYDGSSRFPDYSRWGIFPSVSAGWQIDKETFFEPIRDAVSLLKIRASYGQLGNQNVDVNTFRQLMGLGLSTWLDHGVKLNYVRAPNPLPRVVSWETTSTIDFGVDVGVLQNKLVGSFDWYEKETEGMYLPGKPLPAVFGAAEPRENMAALRNRGFELALTYDDEFLVGGAPLSINASASVSNFKGVITRYDNPEGLMSTYWEGQELGQIWGYHVDGQFQSDEEAEAYQDSFVNPSNSLGEVYSYILNIAQNSEWSRLRGGDIKYVDSDGDGRIDRGNYTLEDHGDLRPIGNAMPQFPFGFNLQATWKGFDLYVAGAGVARQDWYPTGFIYWGTYSRPYLSFIRKDLPANAWTPETPENTYPRIERGYAALQHNRSMYEMNDYYLTNVGFLRVKNLTFGYTLPRELTSRISVKKFRVYFSGENIFTWRFGDLTKYVDPEQAASAVHYSNPGNAVSRSGVESYPMGKTFSLGINLTL